MENFKFTENNYKVIKGENYSTIELNYWDPFIDTVIEKSLIVANKDLDYYCNIYRMKGYKELYELKRI